MPEASVALAAGRFTMTGGGQDLVVSSLFGAGIRVAPWKGMGDGLGEPVPTPLGPTPCSAWAILRSIAAGDLDEDGLDDVVAIDDLGDGALVLLARGDGTFAVSGETSACSTSIQMAVGDPDGDGAEEIVLADPRAGSIQLVEVAGETLEVRSTLTGQGEPVSPVLADLDGDGRDDLALVDLRKGVRVGLARGRTGIGATRILPIPGLAPVLLAIGEATGDGRPDLVVAGFRWGRRDAAIALLPGDGRGGFGAARLTPLGSTPGPTAAKIADLDGDARPEVIVALADGRIEVLGAGPFGWLSRRATVRFGGSSFPRDVATADFDGDGGQEVAIALSGIEWQRGGPPRVRGTGSIALLDGFGPGGFARREELPAGTGPLALTAADFDADGRLDLASAFLGAALADPRSSDEGGIDLFSGAKGGLEGPDLLPTSPMPIDIAGGDFDGDGDEDLAVLGAAAGALWVYENDLGGS